MAKFCSGCGDPLEVGQKFCEKCGYEIEGMQSTISTTPAVITTSVKNTSEQIGGLFDQSRSYYILKERYWDFGSGDILDETGQIIGKMNRKLISIRKRIELQEIDGTVCSYILAQLISIKPTHDLKDPEGKQLARLEKTVFSVLKPKFYLKDPLNNKIMIAQGRFGGFSFTITDRNEKLIATIKKADKWQDVFVRGVFDFKDTYALKIEDMNVDRRLLLGFVIAIDNVLHDQN